MSERILDEQFNKNYNLLYSYARRPYTLKRWKVFVNKKFKNEASFDFENKVIALNTNNISELHKLYEFTKEDRVGKHNYKFVGDTTLTLPHNLCLQVLKEDSKKKIKDFIVKEFVYVYGHSELLSFSRFLQLFENYVREKYRG